MVCAARWCHVHVQFDETEAVDTDISHVRQQGNMQTWAVGCHKGVLCQVLNRSPWQQEQSLGVWLSTPADNHMAGS